MVRAKLDGRAPPAGQSVERGASARSDLGACQGGAAKDHRECSAAALGRCGCGLHIGPRTHGPPVDCDHDPAVVDVDARIERGVCHRHADVHAKAPSVDRLREVDGDVALVVVERVDLGCWSGDVCSDATGA